MNRDFMFTFSDVYSKVVIRSKLMVTILFWICISFYNLSASAQTSSLNIQSNETDIKSFVLNLHEKGNLKNISDQKEYSFDYMITGPFKKEGVSKDRIIFNTYFSYNNNNKAIISAIHHDNDFNVNISFIDNNVIYIDKDGNLVMKKCKWNFFFNQNNLGRLSVPELLSNNEERTNSGIDFNNLFENAIFQNPNPMVLVNKSYSLYSIMISKSSTLDMRLHSSIDHKTYGSWLSSLAYVRDDLRAIAVSSLLVNKNSFTRVLPINWITSMKPIDETLKPLSISDNVVNKESNYPDTIIFNNFSKITEQDDKLLYNYLNHLAVNYIGYQPLTSKRVVSYNSYSIMSMAFSRMYGLLHGLDVLAQKKPFSFYNMSGLEKNSLIFKLGNDYLLLLSEKFAVVIEDAYETELLRNNNIRISWIDDPALRWKRVCRITDEILLNRFWKHCSMRLALEDKLDLHARFAFIAAVADLGCPNMIYECRDMMESITNDKVFAAILAARWKLPFESDHIEAAYQALQKTEVGEPAESALIETLIMMDEIKKINQERLEAWYLSQVIYANSNRRAILVSIITGIPSGREWIAERLITSKDPASLKSVIRKIILERVSATEELKRFDYMTQEECDELKAACKE